MSAAPIVWTWVAIRPITMVASRGVRRPFPQASNTADDALRASAVLAIGGRANATVQLRWGDNNHSKQTRSAPISPSKAFSISLRVSASDASSINLSVARRALEPESFGARLPDLIERTRCVLFRELIFFI